MVKIPEKKEEGDEDSLFEVEHEMGFLFPPRSSPLPPCSAEVEEYFDWLSLSCLPGLDTPSWCQKIESPFRFPEKNGKNRDIISYREFLGLKKFGGKSSELQKNFQKMNFFEAEFLLLPFLDNPEAFLLPLLDSAKSFFKFSSLFFEKMIVFWILKKDFFTIWTAIYKDFKNHPLIRLCKKYLTPPLFEEFLIPSASLASTPHLLLLLGGSPSLASRAAHQLFQNAIPLLVSSKFFSLECCVKSWTACLAVSGKVAPSQLPPLLLLQNFLESRKKRSMWESECSPLPLHFGHLGLGKAAIFGVFGAAEAGLGTPPSLLAVHSCFYAIKSKKILRALAWLDVVPEVEKRSPLCYSILLKFYAQNFEKWGEACSNKDVKNRKNIDLSAIKSALSLVQIILDAAGGEEEGERKSLDPVDSYLADLKNKLTLESSTKLFLETSWFLKSVILVLKSSECLPVSDLFNKNILNLQSIVPLSRLEGCVSLPPSSFEEEGEVKRRRVDMLLKCFSSNFSLLNEVLSLAEKLRLSKELHLAICYDFLAQGRDGECDPHIFEASRSEEEFLDLICSIAMQRVAWVVRRLAGKKGSHKEVLALCLISEEQVRALGRVEMDAKVKEWAQGSTMSKILGSVVSLLSHPTVEYLHRSVEGGKRQSGTIASLKGMAGSLLRELASEEEERG